MARASAAAASARELAQYWSSPGEKSVALWADSSYGPLESPAMLKIAKDLNFPLTSFTCSFGAGLTMKGDFHDPAGSPADVVLIEMGYNDTKNFGTQEAMQQMKMRQWYSVLQKSATENGAIKFVVFIHQPTYRQTCPPRKKKKKALEPFTPGKFVEGSKWTEVAQDG